MMTGDAKKLNGHERYKELCALANSGALSAFERAELKGHLEICGACRDIYAEYQVLAREVIPVLADRYGHPAELENWDDTTTRRKLFARIRSAEDEASSKGKLPLALRPHLLLGIAPSPWPRAALAVCLLVAVSLGAYRLGGRELRPHPVVDAYEVRLKNLAAEKKLSDEQIEAQTKRVSHFEEQSSHLQQQLVKLRSQLNTLANRSLEMAAAKSQADERLRAIAQERDVLSTRLREAEQAYRNVQAELVSLRSERDKARLRTAALESRIGELSSLNRDQERKLKDRDEYLTSDRDIRELMGARKLYIADVFDVDSGSRTQKPFGRVFYTQNKSLIFYAFDLDQPGVKNVSTFQVWGRKETPQGERAHAMNLGILYMDSESNRRWVMRSDDPKQLAEIDAIFVTVEPHGGSQKPTGKPFLYALLRKEANHP